MAEMEKAQIEEQLDPVRRCRSGVDGSGAEYALSCRWRFHSALRRKSTPPKSWSKEKHIEDHIFDSLQEIADVKVKVVNPIRSSDSGEDQPEKFWRQCSHRQICRLTNGLIFIADYHQRHRQNRASGRQIVRRISAG